MVIPLVQSKVQLGLKIGIVFLVDINEKFGITKNFIKKKKKKLLQIKNIVKGK
jgi:hypothetical protein